MFSFETRGHCRGPHHFIPRVRLIYILHGIRADANKGNSDDVMLFLKDASFMETITTTDGMAIMVEGKWVVQNNLVRQLQAAGIKGHVVAPPVDWTIQELRYLGYVDETATLPVVNAIEDPDRNATAHRCELRSTPSGSSRYPHHLC